MHRALFTLIHKASLQNRVNFTFYLNQNGDFISQYFNEALLYSYLRFLSCCINDSHHSVGER